jgi:predicted nucleic acid-binding protein
LLPGCWSPRCAVASTSPQSPRRTTSRSRRWHWPSTSPASSSTPTPARRAAQQAFLEELLAVTPVADYTPEVAGHHAALLAHVRRAGRPRGAHDLIIAATARATDRILVSTDAQAGGFADLPEVEVRMLAS